MNGMKIIVERHINMGMMITKEKQKREKRERRDPNKKEILFVYANNIYTNIYDESFIISRSKSFLDCED